MISNQSGVGFMRTWARWIVGFFSLYVIFSLAYEILAGLSLLTPQLDYFVSLATSATIFFIAWYGKGFAGVAGGLSVLDSLVSHSTQSNEVSRIKMIIEPTKVTDTEKYKNSGLPKTLEIKLSQDLENLMQKHQLYKLNDLKLETLAEKLNTNKHFISQVINEVYKVNFFEYINLKRIEEAKQLLRSMHKRDLNIIEVAYEVGFNNKGTFNSVFKKVTGLTPTEFRNQSKQLLEARSN
jgi:AraC-like DNA-binding protein